MTSAKSVGRMIGILSLVQGAGGFVVNFVLLAPVMTVPPGFLANAAGSALQVRVSVLLGLATGAVTLGIAIGTPIAHALPQRHLRRLLGWVVVLAGVAMLLRTTVRLLSSP